MRYYVKSLFLGKIKNSTLEISRKIGQSYLEKMEYFTFELSLLNLPEPFLTHRDNGLGNFTCMHDVYTLDPHVVTRIPFS